MKVFVDATHQSAHHGFVGWIERNYDEGLVINSHSSRGPMIHCARCGHFKHKNKSQSLTTTQKICFENEDAYDDWTRQNR